MLILGRRLLADLKLRIVLATWLLLAGFLSAHVQALFMPTDKDNVLSVSAKENEVKPQQSKVRAKNGRVNAQTTAVKTASFRYSPVWDRLALCESSGNWSANTGNGYYGGLQFSLASWNFVGGKGYPHEASKQEQIVRAEKLKSIQGWSAWPSCSVKLAIA